MPICPSGNQPDAHGGVLAPKCEHRPILRRGNPPADSGQCVEIADFIVIEIVDRFMEFRYRRVARVIFQHVLVPMSIDPASGSRSTGSTFRSNSRALAITSQYFSGLTFSSTGSASSVSITANILCRNGDTNSPTASLGSLPQIKTGSRPCNRPRTGSGATASFRFNPTSVLAAPVPFVGLGDRCVG